MTVSILEIARTVRSIATAYRFAPTGQPDIMATGVGGSYLGFSARLWFARKITYSRIAEASCLESSFEKEIMP